MHALAAALMLAAVCAPVLAHAQQAKPGGGPLGAPLAPGGGASRAPAAGQGKAGQGKAGQGAPSAGKAGAPKSGADKAAAAPGASAEADLEERYFGICDHDGNGWISFREAEQSLDFDRSEFQLYDRNADGRIDRAEFGKRYQEAVDKVGAFPPPRPAASADLPPVRTGPQLEAAYDRDSSRALEPAELQRVLTDYGFDPQQDQSLVSEHDLDASGALAGNEVDAFARALAARLTPGLQVSAEEGARSIAELFGTVVPRPAEQRKPPEAPYVAGPVPQFLRLDVDRDGFIDERDMNELLQLSSLRVRPRTLLAALDRDDDARISSSEFAAALERAPARAAAK
jgi:Ca2+-binding EF-hand superfamily protein